MRLDSRTNERCFAGPGRMLAGVGLLLAALVLLHPPAAAAGTDSGGHLRVEPEKVELGLFYDGATVQVTAEHIPADTDVAVLCVGREQELDLKKKGKVWGVLWMNVGEVSFAHVPAVYLLSTSKKLDALAPAAVLQGLGVGYEALRARSLTSSPAAADRELFGQMVALKESEDLFSVQEGQVRIQTGAGGEEQISAQCRLPAKTPLGQIEVKLFAFQSGQGRLLDTGQVELSQSGTTAFISSLATEHGLLYGIVSVVIAIIVGLLTGLVFGLGSKKAH